MRKVGVITAGLVIALCGASGPAAAFQETPVPPAESTAKAPEAEQLIAPEAPAAALQTKESAAPKKSASGYSILGFGKLDFGLELLYGSQQQQFQEPQHNPLADQDSSEVKVLGTVKRRF